MMTHRQWSKIYSSKNRFKCITDLQIDWWLRVVGALQVVSEVDDLKRLHIGNKLPCKMRKNLGMGVLIATANDLHDPIFTLWGKGL